MVLTEICVGLNLWTTVAMKAHEVLYLSINCNVSATRAKILAGFLTHVFQVLLSGGKALQKMSAGLNVWTAPTTICMCSYYTYLEFLKQYVAESCQDDSLSLFT